MSEERRLLVAAPVDGVFPTAQVSIGWAKQVYTTGLRTVVAYAQDVVRARNRVAREAMGGNYTHVIWWDTDMIVQDQIIQAMIDTERDVIGAPYARKRQPPTSVGVPIRPEHREGDCVEMLGIGFGLTITSVSALRAMADQVRWYTDVTADNRRVQTPDLFDLAYVNTHGALATGEETEIEKVSEDYSFCARWRAHGGSVWLYTGPHAPVIHAGTFGYTLGSAQ